jgi:ATP-dependent DNA ligase
LPSWTPPRALGGLIDGEAVAATTTTWPRSNGYVSSVVGRHIFLYAFDLLELDGNDLRREPEAPAVKREAEEDWSR